MSVKMFKKAKVWNRDDKPYHQVVNGDEVHIEPGKCIEVSRRRAIEIRGHYAGKGVVCKLEIEPIYEDVEEQEQFVDHRTGRIFQSREALLQHLGISAAAAAEVKKRAKFVCAICDEMLDDKDSYVKHMEKCITRVKKVQGVNA